MASLEITLKFPDQVVQKTVDTMGNTAHLNPNQTHVVALMLPCVNSTLGATATVEKTPLSEHQERTGILFYVIEAGCEIEPA